MAGLQTALEYLERALCCVSCGIVAQELRTHAGCGGAQCRSCWLVNLCPRCHDTVSEQSLWDLNYMLESNEQLVCGSGASMDSFQFLTALRDVVHYEQDLKQTWTAEESSESPTEKLTSPRESCQEEQHFITRDDFGNEQVVKQTPTAEESLRSSSETPKSGPQENFQQHQRLVARNDFGGMAYFGGDQSGKPNTTGRVGRRRWQQQQEEQRPAPQQQQDDSMFNFHSQSSMPSIEASLEASSEGPDRSRGGESGSRGKENYKDGDKPESPQCSQISEPTSEQDSRERLTLPEEIGETSATEMAFMMSDPSNQNFIILSQSPMQASKRPQSEDQRFVSPSYMSRKQPRKLLQSYKRAPQPPLPVNYSLQSAEGSFGQDLNVRPVPSDSSLSTISMSLEAVVAAEKPSHERARETQPIDSRRISSSADFKNLPSSPRTWWHSNSERMKESQMQSTDESSVATALLPATQDLMGLVGSQFETARTEISQIDIATAPNRKPEETRAICLKRNHKEGCGQGPYESAMLGTKQKAIPSQHLPDTYDFWSLLAERNAAKIPEATAGDSEKAVEDEGSGAKHEMQPKTTLNEMTYCSQGIRKQECVQESKESTILVIEQATIASHELPNTCDFRSLLVDEDMVKSSGADVEASAEVDGDERSVSKKLDRIPEDARVTCSQPRYEQECGQGSEVTATISSQNLPSSIDFRTLLPPSRNYISVTMKARDGPPMPAFCPSLICLTLADPLHSTDFDRAARLRKTGRCKTIQNISDVTTHYVPFTKIEQDPFLTNRVASNTKSALVVCLPTLDYYKALALGVSIIDRQWLEESEIVGRWVDEESHRVWGDNWLHRKVIELQNGSDQYLWLQSTTWWGEKCGPCQLPPALRLDHYCILVLDEEQEHRRTPLEQVDKATLHVGDQDRFESLVRENGVVAGPDYYQHLTKEQIETVCGLLGANVFDNERQLAACDPALTRLVLVPASVPPNFFESTVKKRLPKAVLADNHAIRTMPNLNQVPALRSTWLTESLAARYSAPMEKYIHGVLILP